MKWTLGAHSEKQRGKKSQVTMSAHALGWHWKNMYRRSRRGWLVMCLLELSRRENVISALWLATISMNYGHTTIHDPQLFSLRWLMVVWCLCMPRTILHPLLCSPIDSCHRPKMLTRFDELYFSLRAITGRKKQYARCQQNPTKEICEETITLSWRT